MLGLILPILAQGAVEPPRTVNGLELGDATDFAGWGIILEGEPIDETNAQ